MRPGTTPANCMSDFVLDAFAILALIWQEAGSEAVKPHVTGSLISASNYREVLSSLGDKGSALDVSARQFSRFQMVCVLLDADQAVIAASLRAVTRPLGLSLADRACLALALSRKLPVLTADRAWANHDIGVTIELFR